MKKLLAISIAASILSATSTFANDKVVYGGGKVSSSTYSSKYVPAVIDGLAKNRLAGYQWGGITEGTLENVEKVKVNPTHLAVGQYDMIKNMEGVTILHKDIGPECLYMVTKESGYQNLGHVIGNAWDLEVITGGEKSGSYGTWKVLSGIYKDFADMPVTHSSDIIADVVATEKPSIGFMVMRPDPNSNTFKMIAENNLSIIPVVDLDLEVDYNFYNLKVAHSGVFGMGKGQYVETACTSVSLFTGVTDKLEGRQLKRLKATIKRVSETDASVFTPSTSDFRDMFAGMTKMSTDKISKLAAEVKATAYDLAETVAEKAKQ